MAKPRKFRIEFRKNRSARRRDGDVTRALAGDLDGGGHDATGERVSGKGDLTRKRTVTVAGPPQDGIDGLAVQPLAAGAWRGRVLEVHGLETYVAPEAGPPVRCTTRRLLRSLATEQRHPVAAGD